MRPNNFDLNLLYALDVLLRERNVTHAASRLGMTQQAMSGALRRLRVHFNDEILERAGRGLRLTPQADALLAPVRDAIAQIERAVQTRATFDAATDRRRFTVAMSDYAAITILPPVIGALSAAAPSIVLDVRPICDSTIDELERGELDLCLLPSDWSLFGERAPKGVSSAALYRDDFVCVVSRRNGDVGETITPKQYLAMPHAALRLGGGIRSVIEGAWDRLRIAPHVAASATSFSALIFMVTESTTLVATVQRRLAQQFTWTLPIRVLECPIRISPLDAGMNWHKSREHDPAHRYLREVFAEATRAPDHNRDL